MKIIPPLAPIEREEGNTLALAGSLDYRPAFAFPAKVMEALQHILDVACEIDGCENPDVVASWVTWSREPTSRHIIWRSEILLYHDGGDWAEETGGHWEGRGVLFCRRDTDQLAGSVVYRVHVPGAASRDALIASLDYIADLRLGKPDKLLFLRSYLLAHVDDEQSWMELKQLLGELELGDVEEDESASSSTHPPIGEQ